MAIRPIEGGYPYYNLKLDPGEYGFARRVNPKEMGRVIAAQEFGNLISFRREALVKGLDIGYYNISFSGGLEGTTPVLRGGKTSVQFVDKPGIPEQLNKQRERLKVQNTYLKDRWQNLTLQFSPENKDRKIGLIFDQTV